MNRVELVNEGFGANQLVYLLSKALYNDHAIIGVEEPEIHLNPSTARRLARRLAQIALEKNKVFIVTTHSEAFVISFLALVAEKRLEPSKLACYVASKEGKASKFEEQKVSDNGQIEGGLKPLEKP